MKPLEKETKQKILSFVFAMLQRQSANFAVAIINWLIAMYMA